VEKVEGKEVNGKWKVEDMKGKQNGCLEKEQGNWARERR
jgi:hypothetical protein